MGSDLRELRQQRTELHAAGKLKVEVRNLPDLAVVETDGVAFARAKRECGIQSCLERNKTALCMRMSSDVHEHDPA
ncbi:MAG: hypothetical protein R3C59_22055 [Planctomycetaceae bacterium]